MFPVRCSLTILGTLATVSSLGYVARNGDGLFVVVETPCMGHVHVRGTLKFPGVGFPTKTVRLPSTVVASGIWNVQGNVVVSEQNPVVVTVSVPWPDPPPDWFAAETKKVKDPDATWTVLYVWTVSLGKTLSPDGPSGTLKLNVTLYLVMPGADAEAVVAEVRETVVRLETGPADDDVVVDAACRVVDVPDEPELPPATK
jgi:hypothetical protein